jgi:hypothetical protein
MRRQLTLFLPPKERALVDEIRKELDPRQFAIIPAHVTLCRDEELDPWPVIRQRLASLRPFTLDMQFGGAEVLPDGCVLLRSTLGIEAYQTLRGILLGPIAKQHGAHITLLHPRHAAGASYSLPEISQRLSGLAVPFRSVSVIEQLPGEAWVMRSCHGAAP